MALSHTAIVTPGQSDLWGIEHRKKTKHGKQADILCFCRALFNFCGVLFSLVLLLKHRRCLSSWKAVVLCVQGALSLLLLPLAWPNKQIVGRSCRSENWHVCEVALK